MAKYSPEFQEHTVRQLMSPVLRSVAQVSRESGVSEPTLYAWKKRYQEQGAIVLGKTPTALMPPSSPNGLPP